MSADQEKLFDIRKEPKFWELERRIVALERANEELNEKLHQLDAKKANRAGRKPRTNG